MLFFKMGPNCGRSSAPSLRRGLPQSSLSLCVADERPKIRAETWLWRCRGLTVSERRPARLPPALTAWPFETAPTCSRGVELGAIRIWPVVAASGSFRGCYQSLQRVRSHGADASERFWIGYRSLDHRVHQLEHTQAIPLVRQNRNDDTWHAYPASSFLLDL